jgi:hypothetical protein
LYGPISLESGISETEANGMWEMVAPKSTVTARDMTRAMLEDVNEIPTLDGATRIADEYWLRGVYIRPEYLLDVWLELWK